jgi:hypothetical protein
MMQLQASADVSSVAVAVSVSSASGGSRPKTSQAELDSHANMVVIGPASTVIRRTGMSVNVKPFTNEVGSLSSVPLVDAVIVYEVPGGETYFLVVYNALYVPSMDHHLIPPFLLREAGLIVNEVPKIQSQDPTEETHSIFDAESGLRIPLQLHGIFSCFKCRGMTREEMENWRDYPVIHATPSGEWDPYNTVYADEEAGFTAPNGEFIDDRLPSVRNHLLVDDEDVLGHISACDFTKPVSTQQFDDLIQGGFSAASVMTEVEMDNDDLQRLDRLNEDDGIMKGLAGISSTYVEEELADALSESSLMTAAGIAAGSLNDSGLTDDLFFDDMEAIISAATATFSALASGNQKGVSAERLGKIWRISHQDAQNTIDVTSQMGRHSAETTLEREMGTGDRSIRYRRLVDTVFYTDTMFVTGKAKSTRGYKCVQVFVSDKGYVHVALMKTQSEYLMALRQFCKEVGVPVALVCDPHPTQTSNEVRKFMYEVGATLRCLERATQWANLAERFIGLLKNGVRADLRESNCPMVLWDFAIERRAAIMNLTARDTNKLRRLNPYTATYGDVGDISNLCQFGWFEWVWYLEDRKASRFGFPHAIKKLGRCLGPSRGFGNELCQWVLSQNGKVLPRRTIARLSPAELAVTNEVEQERRKRFMDDIRRVLGDSLTLPTNTDYPLPTIEEESTECLYNLWLEDTTTLEGWGVDDGKSFDELLGEVMSVKMPEADVVDMNGKPVDSPPMGDILVGVELLLPSGEGQALCKVLRQSLDETGKVKGTFNDNPMLNSMIYDVEFPDGVVREYRGNVIAMNVLDQVDTEGHHTIKLKRILDHQRDGDAVSKADKFIRSRNGQMKLRKTTVGWKFLVEYSDGSKKWEWLKDLKEVYPVDIAEYVAARDLISEAAFEWWCPYTLSKKQSIIAAVKARAKKKTHKYGIEIPKDINDAIRLDRENGNTLWMDALGLEMNELGVAIHVVGGIENVPKDFIKVSGHIVWDLKMDFTRKCRWVKDGHRTPLSDQSNYAGVVSRESVRIAFTYAAMMDLPVCAGDVRNAFLQAPASEKHYIICGPEFGPDKEGQCALITRSIYGGRVCGRDFWLHLRKCMRELGFTSSKGDPDVWFRPATKPDGTEYMEFVLCYVDDVLCISHRAEEVVRYEIGRHWDLKESSIEKPTIYLGGKCREVELENGTKCWAFGSSQYVQAAVKNVEEWLNKQKRQLPTNKYVQENMKLPKRADAPFKNGYRPEVDISRELSGDEASYYQSLIGILRWIVELGRADICLEVSLMSSHLAMPREGHLEALFHIFAYLKKYHNAEMVYDPTRPVIDESAFPMADWTLSSMGEAEQEEVLPPDMPKPRGKGFIIRVFIDADHAGDEVTRRSRTGFIVYINNAPVYWYSKRQGSVESSTYQAEFTAMKEAAEYVRALRYRLRMMGIPVEGPAYIFGDNRSVLANTTNPGSMLKKKCAAIAYHLIREGVARGEWITAWISTHDNVADLLTKPMTSGEKRNGFVKKILQHIFRKE